MATSQSWSLFSDAGGGFLDGMTTTLTLLGTAGGPTPRGYRAAPSQVVVVDGVAYVFDCGNGVAEQLARAGIPFSAVRAVFITHQHSDHNADLGNLFLLGWSRMSQPVDVFGPPPLSEAVKHFLAMQRYDIDIRVEDEGRRPLDELITTHEIIEGGAVYIDDKVTVRAALVDHPPLEHAFGYRIDSADRSIVISGDTRPCDALVDLARGADVLVHEALHQPALGKLLTAHNGGRILDHLLDSHTQSHEVGGIAARADVGTLVLSHLVPSDDTVDDHTWRSQAAQGFGGRIIVGRDLLQI